MAAEPERLPQSAAENDTEELDAAALRERVAWLELRVAQAEERRRALLHIMGDLNESNRRLGDQRKAMLHILGDYEDDRSRLAQSNVKLGDSRKAMIHIMGDLRETTQEMERREQELREKQEQLVQAGKLATLGELTTGVAHELNNPLNNIGLFVGNVLDQLRSGDLKPARVEQELESAMEQVQKATAIISHLRTFGRAAPVSLQPVDVDEVIERSLLLMQEQLRLRGIEIGLDLCSDELVVLGNAIQLEQVFINLLTNSRDALDGSRGKTIRVATSRDEEWIRVRFADTGPGIPRDLEQRIFDPFFTTKEVGTGTGLGLSITYSIVKEHGGSIAVEPTRRGAAFLIELPAMREPVEVEPLL